MLSPSPRSTCSALGVKGRVRVKVRVRASVTLPRYVLNEVELHPGFYVDWDPDPDATIEPLAHAYGEP